MDCKGKKSISSTAYYRRCNPVQSEAGARWRARTANSLQAGALIPIQRRPEIHGRIHDAARTIVTHALSISASVPRRWHVVRLASGVIVCFSTGKLWIGTVAHLSAIGDRM